MEETVIRWLVHMWQGYVRVLLTGISPERFFNICRMQEVEIWDIRKEEDGYVCCMSVQGFRGSRPLIRKAKVRLRIRERFGLPFFLYRNRKRKLSALGMLLFAVLLYGMTWVIWDVTFLGNVRYTDEVLLDYLKEQNITYGMNKAKVHCEELEEKIRLDFPEITWVSARVAGTRLIVQVKENEILEKTEEKESVTGPCDLVAAKSGTIVSVVVRSGVPKVKAGDSVEAGQMLVEGRVPILNDSKEMVREQLVVSDADVTARCVTEYKNHFSMLHQEKSLTGKVRKGLYLKVFGSAFAWILPGSKENTWEVTTTVYPLHIWEDFFLPVSVGVIEAKEYVPYETWYSEEEANLRAEKELSEFLVKFAQKGVQILENDVKVISNGSECVSQGTITTVEQIALPAAISRTITETEENSDTDEYIGDNH